MKTLKAQVIISLITCLPGSPRPVSSWFWQSPSARETSLGTFFLKAKIQQKAKQDLPGYYDIQMTEYR